MRGRRAARGRLDGGRWYFRAARPPEENRHAVLELAANAPEKARRVLGIAKEDEKIVWWWPRLALLAKRPEVAKSARET